MSKECVFVKGGGILEFDLADGDRFTGLSVGIDGRLYAYTHFGRIFQSTLVNTKHFDMVEVTQ